jgi:ATP-dependent helicase/nuclease subunit A
MLVEPLIQPPYAPLIAARAETAEPSGPEVELVRYVPEEQQEWSAEEGRLVEAQAIADWIQENVPSRFQYRDIALLFRSAHAFEPYLEAFRAREIPYVAEGEKSFYRTPELVTFFNLISVIADPTDKLALVGVLRSPLGALNDGEIWELKKADGLNPLIAPPLHADRIGSLYRSLQRLSEDARMLPLPVVLRRVLSTLWVRELSGGEQAKANIEKVLRLAQTWSEPMPLTLAEFVAHFGKYRDEERDEGENPLADAMFDAVKVMTIHKAKGLEFPVVFLPNLSGGRRAFADRPRVERSWRSGSVGIRLRGVDATNAAAAVLSVQSRRHEEAEEVRIFYVAATRAKNRLICTMSKTGGQPGPFAKLLAEAGVKIEERLSTLSDATFQPRGKTAAASNADLSRLIASLQARATAFDRVKNFRFFASPSQLAHEPDKKTVEDDEENPAREEAISAGLICHKVLEWDFSGQWPHGLKKGKAAIAEAGRLFDVSAERESGKRVLNDAKNILTGFYASDIYADLKKQKILGCEVPFLYPLAAPDTSFAMHGIMDLVYEQDGRVIVADYKTSRVSEETKSAVVERYTLQGAAYQEAVRRALGQDADFELIFLRANDRVRLGRL